jgi:hypothetical protein
MNSEATQSERSNWLLLTETQPTVRSLAVVGSSANAEGRKNCRAARRSSTSRREPLPAGCQALAPGVLHGRQATLKDEHPSPTPSGQHPVFNTLKCVRSPFGPSVPTQVKKLLTGEAGTPALEGEADDMQKEHSKHKESIVCVVSPVLIPAPLGVTYLSSACTKLRSKAHQGRRVSSIE